MRPCFKAKSRKGREKANNYIKIMSKSKRKLYLYLANCVIIYLYMDENMKRELTKMNSLQDQMDSLNSRIQEERNKGMQEDNETMLELQQAKRDLQSRMDNQAVTDAAANLQDHVQAHGYTLDSITIADVPVSECGLDEDSYNILREKVEAVIVGQAATFNKQIAEILTANQAETKRLNDLNSQLTESSVATMQENYQLKAENESISTSRDNAARLLDEANAESAKKDDIIKALKDQIALGNSVANIDYGEQVKRQEDAKKASRIKVISMVKNDPSGVSDRLWDIVLANNGEKLTINYLEKGKYTVISAEEAAQAQADIEASNNIPALNPISEEPAAASTPQETVPASTTGLDGNQPPAEVVGTKTETVVVPTEKSETDIVNYTYGEVKRVDRLETQLAQLYVHLNIVPDQAVA